MTQTHIARLLARYEVATQRAAADHRALVAEALYAELGTDELVAEEVSAWLRRKIGRGTIEQLRRRARDEVHADPRRYAAALTLGGPIPTSHPERTVMTSEATDWDRDVAARVAERGGGSEAVSAVARDLGLLEWQIERANQRAREYILHIDPHWDLIMSARKGALDNTFSSLGSHHPAMIAWDRHLYAAAGQIGAERGLSITLRRMAWLSTPGRVTAVWQSTGDPNLWREIQIRAASLADEAGDRLIDPERAERYLYEPVPDPACPTCDGVGSNPSGGGFRTRCECVQDPRALTSQPDRRAS